MFHGPHQLQKLEHRSQLVAVSGGPEGFFHVQFKIGHQGLGGHPFQGPGSLHPCGTFFELAGKLPSELLLVGRAPTGVA